MSDFELIGSSDAVAALARAIGRMGRVDFRRELLAEMADEALRLVREEFFVSRDPYGMPWAPLKRQRFGAGPLLRTGRMQGRIRRRVFGDGFALMSPVEQSTFHQYGTRKMVARPIFPDPEHLPPEWERAFERIADEAVTRALAGAV